MEHEAERPVIEMWSTANGKWEYHSTYLDMDHAKQCLELLQATSTHMRFRIKPQVRH